MSNLVEIKKRIASITSTIKVTKVMQMIATAKVAKIKQMMVIANRYQDMSQGILSSYCENTENNNDLNRFFAENNNYSKKVLLVLMSSDKGTCGSINTNIFKEFTMLVKQYHNDSSEIYVYPIGKKAAKFLETNQKKLNIETFSSINNDAEDCNSKTIDEVVNLFVNAFADKKIDEINFVYHKFKNIITCNTICEKVLPLQLEANNQQENGNSEFTNIYETENTAINMIKFFAKTKLYTAYISNLASIVSSRMNAMDNATKNGQEIIDELRIKYNKGRQASITSELSDIVSGFEAIS